MFLADAKQSQDSSLHPSVKVSHKHLIRTVLRQVSCLHLAIVPKGFISFDQIERSSDLPFWCGSVHTSAPACFLSGVLVCPVCVCARYPVSVLPPVWFALARTCPGPHLDAGKPIATWAPTYPTFHSTLPFFLPGVFNSSSFPSRYYRLRHFSIPSLPHRYIAADFPVPWTWICPRAAARRRCNLKLSSKETRRLQVRPHLALRRRHPLAE